MSQYEDEARKGPRVETAAQRLMMLMSNAGLPGNCPVCNAPIRTITHINGQPIPYDFIGQNEGSPHECPGAPDEWVCATCKHDLYFHFRGQDHCREVGCTCQSFDWDPKSSSQRPEGFAEHIDTERVEADRISQELDRRVKAFSQPN